MQGGIHLLSGLLIASLSKRKEFKLAAVLGAILPDIDIVVAAVAYLIIRSSGTAEAVTKAEAAVEAIHRSFTHSLIFVIAIPLLIFFVGLIPRIKEKYNYDSTGFALGLFVGIAMHIFLDMLYIDTVYFLWPSRIAVGFPIVPFESFDEFAFQDMFKLKMLQTTDFYTDIFFFYIPMIYLSYKMDVHKKIRLPFLIYAVLDFIVISVFFGLMYNFNISYRNHVVYMYFPGTFFLLISVISPLLFRNVIREFKLEWWEIILIIALICFSQILFYV